MAQPTVFQRSDEDVPSTVYAILPAVIQSRIPRLKSLRRTVTGFRSSHAQLHRVAGAQSPPPSYTSRPASAAMRRGSGVSDRSLPEEKLVDERRSSSSSLPGYNPLDMPATVNWKYATQGQHFPAMRSTARLLTADRPKPSHRSAPVPGR